MDVYSETRAFGIAVHTRDTELILKRFQFEKSDNGSRMGVEYGFFRPIELEAKEAFVTPNATIEFHAGDWRAPLRAYRDWLSEWYEPKSNARGSLKNVFICRRDYPIGGTGYLFDPAADTYTFPNLITESRGALGGIDMIDISGWAYSETHGRVGAYERYELGGKENLRRGIEESRRQGIPVGLYLEGYLIDPRSQVGQEHGKEWQIVGKDGKPKQWPGNEEIFVCPHCKDWQEYMSDTLLQAANDTGAGALYLDQYGFADGGKACYSPDHGHPIGAHPLTGELEMLKRARQKLNGANHPVSLYCEQVPCDIVSQYVDAAFSYNMWGKRNFDSPSKLNLFRYAIPDLTLIELFHPGIDPKGVSEEDIKLCFFHGHAMWLKGRARSWYSHESRAFIQKAYRIFHEHIDAFTSNTVEPLLPTQHRGLYANRFSSDKEDIITLYNTRYHTIRGPLLTISAMKEQTRDIWGIDEFDVKQSGNDICIWGQLNPHEIGCIVIRKKR